MEVIKNRYGYDRTVEKLNHNTMRVMGVSPFIRTSENRKGETVMFDFEGGPCLTVGGKINFGKLNWKILSINPDTPGYKDVNACLIEVTPLY